MWGISLRTGCQPVPACKARLETTPSRISRSGRTGRAALPTLLGAMLVVRAAVAAPVKVGGGLLEGRSESGLTVHRGVPFAAPPVGSCGGAASTCSQVGRSEASRSVRSGRESGLRRQRGLPVPERVYSGHIAEPTHTRPGVDLRRRFDIHPYV